MPSMCCRDFEQFVTFSNLQLTVHNKENRNAFTVKRRIVKYFRDIAYDISAIKVLCYTDMVRCLKRLKLLDSHFLYKYYYIHYLFSLQRQQKIKTLVKCRYKIRIFKHYAVKYF